MTAGVLAGVFVGGATSASAATHWSGNYPTKAACDRARIAHHDYGQRTTTCSVSYDRAGNRSYFFHWFS
ncbi:MULTISPECIES: hypothetical protein [Cellulomonas]|uniref:hypothetical protein n=1 Tax=Cellulomonas TaxID=1707 RepID=UPI0010A8B1AF|nr:MULTISPECIES: hypothetical protein [Cellulomonas]